MKKLLYLFLILTTSFVHSQTVDIPDSNFKNALVTTVCADFDGDGFLDGDVDTNNDGEIQVTEAESVFVLDVEDRSIASLVGIESFVNLIGLDCSLNQLTSLDVSQNTNIFELLCSDNQLSDLDLSANPAITTLYCEYNQLVSLNIKNGNNPALTSMWAFNNPDLLCIQVDDENASNPICDFNEGDGWCVDQGVEFSEDCNLGITDINKGSLMLYPNPVQNFLTVVHDLSISEIEIYSIQGKLLLQTSTTEAIDLSHLRAGVYLAAIHTVDGKIVNKRFIKS